MRSGRPPKIGKSCWKSAILVFCRNGKFAKPDAHHYEVCYQLDKNKNW